MKNLVGWKPKIRTFEKDPLSPVAPQDGIYGAFSGFRTFPLCPVLSLLDRGIKILLTLLTYAHYEYYNLNRAYVRKEVWRCQEEMELDLWDRGLQQAVEWVIVV